MQEIHEIREMQRILRLPPTCLATAAQTSLHLFLVRPKSNKTPGVSYVFAIPCTALGPHLLCRATAV